MMIHFLVGDLFVRKNYLLRFYEKDEFYAKKVQENIKYMVQVLLEKNSGNEVDSLQIWEKKENILFTRPQKAMSIPQILVKNLVVEMMKPIQLISCTLKTN